MKRLIATIETTLGATGNRTLTTLFVIRRRIDIARNSYGDRTVIKGEQ